jgi:hypothetical protein
LKAYFLESKYRTSLLVRELIERRGMRRLRNGLEGLKWMVPEGTYL